MASIRRSWLFIASNPHLQNVWNAIVHWRRRLAGQEAPHGRKNIGDMVGAQSRVQADPERAVGNDIGGGEFAHDAIGSIAHIGLAGKISAEQQPGADTMRVEILDRFVARKWRAL